MTSDKPKPDESKDKYEYFGAGIKADEWIATLSHPLIGFYPLSGRINKIGITSYFDPRKIKNWNPFGEYMRLTLDEMRNFYGEYIAFYFAWMNFFDKSLTPMCVFAILWGILYSFEKIFNFDVTHDGLVCLICVLVFVLWSTVTNELWFREENYLRLKWGMNNYQKIERSMPLFEGKYVNGIKVHRSITYYWCKIIISYIIIAGLLAGLTTAYVFILRFNEYADTEDKYTYIVLLGIGLAISTLMVIVDFIFMFIAIALNNWENHRLRFTYENHLGVKLVVFRFVSTFYSIFWLAFIDDQQQTDAQRMYNIRFQLITLFVSSILLPNILLFLWYQFGMGMSYVIQWFMDTILVCQ